MTILPQVLNAGGASVPTEGVLPIDANGAALFSGSNPGLVAQLPGNYTQTSVVLTANQAAGTDPLLPANAARRALQLAAVNASGAGVDFKVALVANAAAGMPVYGSARDDFTGSLCPAGAIYLVSGSGLVAGNTVVVWEAQ